MKVPVIGAAGKTGRRLVSQSLERGWETVAVCREESAGRLDEFAGREGFTLVTAPVISDGQMLTSALEGCDAVAMILISARKLKATDLVRSLALAMEENSVTRLVSTSGEMTTVLEEGEKFTLRQKVLSKVFVTLMELSPYSMSDMIKASRLIHAQPGWDWTIVRAPTLTEDTPRGYRLAEIDEVTSRHKLSREDYAACMLDSIGNREHFRKTLTVLPA
jgi:putative NADH-flavin reductase